MRFRSLAGGVALLFALTLMPASANAATATQGADLNAPADGGFGCETGFLPGYPPDFTYQPFATGMTSCTLWTPGSTVQGSSLVPGSGTVTRVRVKSGGNPAPLRAVVIRRLFQTNPNNPNEITDAQCCTGVREGPVFQPAPNAISQSVVNLPVEAVPAKGNLSGWHDIVAVSAVGPGHLPIQSTGPHDSNAGTTAGTPDVWIHYPKIDPGRANNNPYTYPNYRPLVQYDWQSCAGAAGARASQACSGTGGGGGGGGTAPKAPASVLSRSLKMRKGKVKVSVRCTAPKSQRCKGRLSLRTRAKKPKALASKKLSIRGGRKATVTLKLSRKARKRVRKKKNKVQAVVNLGKQGISTKNLTLKR